MDWLDMLTIDVLDIMLANGWSEEYTISRNIDLIAAMGMRSRQQQLGGFVPSMSVAEPPDKWKTRRWEEDLGGGKKRVHSRVNVSDLFDKPHLLNDAMSGK
jgi:hypothetical protein